MRNIFILCMLLPALHTVSQNDQASTDWANLHKYASQNKTLKPPAKGKKRVVFMGDSITEGWQSADSSFFADNDYIDRGISGQTTPQMLIRFRPDVIALQPSVVVILAGINDIAENTGPISTEAIYGNIVSMVQLAQANKIRVVVSSVLPANTFPWRLTIQPAEKVIMLNSMLSAYCTANNIVYLDYYSKMVDAEKGLDRKLTYDGVHPTLAGYKVMEPLAQDAIRRALKQAK
jgi:lysophospholipase L1-like esterase